MEYNILSKKMHEIRQQNSLQQKELADAIGVNPPMYSKFETGKRLIQLEQLESFASHCCYSFKELKVLWLADRISHTLNRYNISNEEYQNAISVINNEINEYGNKQAIAD